MVTIYAYIYKVIIKIANDSHFPPKLKHTPHTHTKKHIHFSIQRSHFIKNDNPSFSQIKKIRMVHNNSKGKKEKEGEGKKEKKKAEQWWCTPLVPAGRQRQADL